MRPVLPLVLVALVLACAPTARRPVLPAPVIAAEAITADSVPSIPGFSAAVKRGLTVFVSGQAPLDASARLVASGDLRGQARQALGNLVRLVRAARGLPGDVVQLTFYVRDLGPGDGAILQAAAGEVFTELPRPAVTLIGVASLPEPGMRVVVDGVALLRSEYPDRAREDSTAGR